MQACSSVIEILYAYGDLLLHCFIYPRSNLNPSSTEIKPEPLSVLDEDQWLVGDLGSWRESLE